MSSDVVNWSHIGGVVALSGCSASLYLELLLETKRVLNREEEAEFYAGFAAALPPMTGYCGLCHAPLDDDNATRCTSCEREFLWSR